MLDWVGRWCFIKIWCFLLTNSVFSCFQRDLCMAQTHRTADWGCEHTQTPMYRWRSLDTFYAFFSRENTKNMITNGYISIKNRSCRIHGHISSYFTQEMAVTKDNSAQVSFWPFHIFSSFLILLGYFTLIILTVHMYNCSIRLGLGFYDYCLCHYSPDPPGVRQKY